jgi:acetyl esterase/lipase
MKSWIAFLAGVLIFTPAAFAQNGTVIRLWEGAAPGALGTNDVDIPTLTLYLPPPSTATGAAIVVCPGGGYGMLAPHEGDLYARWLTNQGIAGLVLKYRLAPNNYHHPAMLNDVTRAMRQARFHAADWHIDPKRLGVMGSSAGGHLASTILTHFDGGNSGAEDPVDKQSSRPDLGILCYPVITMSENTHQGSKNNLLGKNPPADLVELLSNEKRVTKDTPPCFIWHTWEDKGVKIENAMSFAAALQAAGVPFDFHVYEKGGHGIGLGTKEFEPAKFHPWSRDCSYWLNEHGFLKKASTMVPTPETNAETKPAKPAKRRPE